MKKTDIEFNLVKLRTPVSTFIAYCKWAYNYEIYAIVWDRLILDKLVLICPLATDNSFKVFCKELNCAFA